MAIASQEARTQVNPAATPPLIEQEWFRRTPPLVWLIAFLLLIMPLIASNFVLFQIFGWAFILGMIALSLMFLAGYGGMVSLAQMTIAGSAGYMIAIFGDSGIDAISLNWPWWITIPIAIMIATLFGTLCGALAVRTEGIYTRDRRSLLLLHPPKLCRLQWLCGLQRRAPARNFRRELARGHRLLLSHAFLGDAQLSGRSLRLAITLRSRSSRHPGQSEAHGSPRL